MSKSFIRMLLPITLFAICTFTAGYAGENFEILWGDATSGQTSLRAAGVNPGDQITRSVINDNVSPFSVFTSHEMFSEMLAQNEAEASRLMKQQEHIENNIVNTEQAWGKIMDTDYARESSAHAKNSMKMQMANNVIGKSIRMNDLLIDLTTKHYRGSMLNAKA